MGATKNSNKKNTTTSDFDIRPDGNPVANVPVLAENKSVKIKSRRVLKFMHYT